MPGHDDTLNAGGPEADPLDELCTCSHTRGEHHTLDEACTDPSCECCAFQAVNAEFGNAEVDPRAQVQLERMDALADAHRDSIGDSVRELTADLPGGEGRIGEIKNELDQILDAALLCDDSNCRHRRDRHKHDGCNDCDCPTFLEPKSTEPETLEVPVFLRAGSATRNNTREAVDVWSNDARAREMDAEAMSPTEGMTDEERIESDAVQAETLDNLCTCGHRYGDHASSYGELCLNSDCECVKFEALLKPVAVTDTLLPDRVRPTDEQVERILGDNPFRITRCAGCGHEKDDHDLAERHACVLDGCGCQAFVEYTGAELDPKGITFAHDENIGPHPDDIEAGIFAGLKRYRDEGSAIDHEALERDRRLPYTPPLLRKKYIGEDELRKVLTDAGRLDLLKQLPEPQVDRVTTNYDAEHWSEIERLALSPQGSSETNTASERTTKAIALALLELRQCLGVTDYTDRLVKHIEDNAVMIRHTTQALDRIVDRVLGAEGK